jgi:hypothetical protein
MYIISWLGKMLIPMVSWVFRKYGGRLVSRVAIAAPIVTIV